MLQWWMVSGSFPLSSQTQTASRNMLTPINTFAASRRNYLQLCKFNALSVVYEYVKNISRKICLCSSSRQHPTDFKAIKRKGSFSPPAFTLEKTPVQSSFPRFLLLLHHHLPFFIEDPAGSPLLLFTRKKVNKGVERRGGRTAKASHNNVRAPSTTLLAQAAQLADKEDPYFFLFLKKSMRGILRIFLTF